MEQKKVKKGSPPPRYDAEFKAGAVRLVTEQGRQPTDVAKELGICIDTLRSWLKVSGVQMGEASRQNREQQRIRELEAEVRALPDFISHPLLISLHFFFAFSVRFCGKGSQSILHGRSMWPLQNYKFFLILFLSRKVSAGI